MKQLTLNNNFQTGNVGSTFSPILENSLYNSSPSGSQIETSVYSIDDDFTLILNDSLAFRNVLKNGTVFTLRKGTFTKSFKIFGISNSSSRTKINFYDKTVYPKDSSSPEYTAFIKENLSPFTNDTFPSVATDVHFSIISNIFEGKISSETEVRNITFIKTDDSLDSSQYNLNVTWETASEVTATNIRHRAIPNQLTLVDASINYVSVVSGGTGYTGASFSCSGASISLSANIVNTSIYSVDVLSGGQGFTGPVSVTITPYGTGGTGASVSAHLDMYSNWNYSGPWGSSGASFSNFKRGINYELQFLTLTEEKKLKFYSDSYNFYSK